MKTFLPAVVPCCVLECLEPRLAPAGVVAVSTAGGVLTLTGDGLDNNIQILEQGNQWFIWNGGNVDTTQYSLNGAPAVVSLTIAPMASIKATLNAGNDYLRISELAIAGAVTVFGNAGNDEVSIFNSLVQGAVKIEGGDGNDQVRISGVTLTKMLTVKTGLGDDVIAIGSGVFGNILADAGTGNDHVLAQADNLNVMGTFTAVCAGGAGTLSQFGIYTKEGLFTGKVKFTHLTGDAKVAFGLDQDMVANLAGGLSLKTGNGNDTFLFTDDVIIRGLFEINAGHGNNVVTTEGDGYLNFGSFKYTGGTGNDTVQFGGTRTLIGGSVMASLGAGATNRLEFTGSDLLIGGVLTYKGGTGGDALTLDNARTHVSGVLSFSGGHGSNALSIDSADSRFGSITAMGGVDGDSFRLAGASVTGKVSVSHGTGGSNVQIVDSLLQSSLSLTSAAAAGSGENVDITTSHVVGAVTLTASGTANTTYNVHNNMFGNVFNLSSGGGNDKVYLDIYAQTSYNAFKGAVKILLGAGDDDFQAGATPPANNAGNLFSSTLKLDGGTGTDRAFFLVAYNNSFSATPAPVGFETVL